MMRIGFLALLVAFATAVSAHSAPSCTIDPTRVLSWSTYHTLTEPSEDTYTVEYKGCGKRLIYVAARHSNDPKSATFVAVQAALAEKGVGFVVLEGFPSNMGVNPAPLIEHSAKVASGPGDAEPYLAVRLAHAAHIDFTGGEPTDAEILAFVKTAGLTEKDLFAFYVLRQIEQWTRAERLTGAADPRLDGEIKRYAPIFARDAGVAVATFADVATLNGFKSWYQAKNGIAFDTGYKPEDAYPSGPGSRPTNAISDKVSDARDRHIVSIVAAALQKHDTVVMVYGASHHLMEAPAFEAAFGPGRSSLTPR